MKNFTVGPVNSSASVLKIGSEQTPYFRTASFSDLLLENEGLIKEFSYADKETTNVVFITGSGTAGMEASVINTLTKKDKVLIVNGGTFGQRFANICLAYEIPFVEINIPLGENITLTELDKYKDKGFTALLINTCETSTGTLYDMKLVSNFCKENNLFLIADCISAFIADEFRMNEIKADVMITSSQKALACPPGISILLLSERAKSRIDSNHPKAFYLDLKPAIQNMMHGQTPFTPAVSILRQINTRLKEIKQNGGIDVERRKIKALANDFRSKIISENLPLACFSKNPSNSVTSIRTIGCSAYMIFQMLESDYGIWVCPNGGELKDAIFRVGHLGALTTGDNDILINALKDLQKRKILR